jgi:DnaJ domain
LLVLWIVIVATVLFLGFGTRRAASPEARTGWLAGLAVLVSVVLATRLGPRALFAIVPTLAWLASAWLRAKAASEKPGPASTSPHARGPMTREEALRVLGLREGASSDAIAKAHRNLIKKVHPDHGGSDVLAQQVNEAKRALE